MPDINKDFLWHFSSPPRYRHSFVAPASKPLPAFGGQSSRNDSPVKVQKIKRSFSEIRQRPALYDYWTKKYSGATLSQSFLHKWNSNGDDKLLTYNEAEKKKILCNPWYSVNNEGFKQQKSQRSSHDCTALIGHNGAQEKKRKTILEKLRWRDDINAVRSIPSPETVPLVSKIKQPYINLPHPNSHKQLPPYDCDNFRASTNRNRTCGVKSLEYRAACRLRRVPSFYQKTTFSTNSCKSNNDQYCKNTNKIYNSEQNEAENNSVTESYRFYDSLPISVSTRCINSSEVKSSDSVNQSQFPAGTECWPVTIKVNCGIKIPRISLSDHLELKPKKRTHDRELETPFNCENERYNFGVNIHQITQQTSTSENRPEEEAFPKQLRKANLQVKPFEITELTSKGRSFDKAIQDGFILRIGSETHPEDKKVISPRYDNKEARDDRLIQGDDIKQFSPTNGVVIRPRKQANDNLPRKLFESSDMPLVMPLSKSRSWTADKKVQSDTLPVEQTSDKNPLKRNYSLCRIRHSRSSTNKSSLPPNIGTEVGEDKGEKHARIPKR
ncbi:unnamed protein product, partial [Enterobius vermicularis]|uniref:Non-specific serine/threonine protein kinase n=1 Tax=Enterobius vermicularis TaxID=51028 RepID=A0A0N4VEH0_ENTVE